MDRRDVLGWMMMSGVAGAAVAAGPAHHDHAAMTGKYTALIGEAGHCIDTGEACLSHCLMMLGDGHSELAGCARTVRDLLAGCGALRQLAAAGSSHTPKMAVVVAQICKDCAAECRKHADKHEICRNCAQACDACAKECEKVAA
jgi:Cys-rich four helix bundle protein (predicted Tat secretion target)